MIGLNFSNVSVSSHVAYDEKSLVGGPPNRDNQDVLLLVPDPQHAKQALGCAISAKMMCCRSLHYPPLTSLIIGWKYLSSLLAVGKKLLLARQYTTNSSHRRRRNRLRFYQLEASCRYPGKLSEEEVLTCGTEALDISLQFET